MRSGELAHEAGVNVQTLRYYERRGLLAQPARTVHGYRDYPTMTLTLLRFIKRAQELGFSLDEIDELVRFSEGGPDSCDAARDLARARLVDLQARIADLVRMRDSLSELAATCDLPRSDRQCSLLAAIAADAGGASADGMPSTSLASSDVEAR